MPVARVVCTVTLRVELYDQLDSLEARLTAEGKILDRQAVIASQPEQQAEPLNPDAGQLGEEGPPGNGRPYFVLTNVRPISWSFVFNSFRKADEAEFTIPLALLPVPPESIRVITAFAAVRHISADEWALTRGYPVLVDESLDNIDFAGICMSESISITEGEIPTAKLPCRDFVGLLAGKKVEVGKTLDRKLPIAKAIEKFIEGTTAEKIDVVWADKGEPEPSVDEHIPKAVKRKASGKAATPTKGQQNYLDAITEECSRLGVVPRLDVTTLELNDAGALYEGRGMNAKASILVGQVVESIEAEHALVGVKAQSIQAVGYNPDTSDMYTARWPPGPKGAKAQVVEKGKPPRLPPVVANAGLPGYEQMEESVLLIPIGAVSSQDRLLKIAKMIFLERTRQRIRYTVKTHVPWSNQAEPDRGDLLRLRAGDVVQFGYLAPGDGGDLVAPVVRALTGGYSAASMATLLMSAGVPEDAAKTIGAVLERVPRLSAFRVDELHVSGGHQSDTEITLRLVNFTQIVDDTQQKEEGVDIGAFVKALGGQIEELQAATMAVVDSVFESARKKIAEMSTNEQVASEAQTELDALQAKAMEGR